MPVSQRVGNKSIKYLGCTIYTRFNVAYGAPAPREGVHRREGGTLGAGGYTRVLPPRGYRANPNPDHNPELTLTLT